MNTTKAAVYLTFLLQTTLFAPASAKDPQQFALSDSLQTQFRAIQQQMLNPALRNLAEMRQWTWNYENLLLDLQETGVSSIESDSALSELLNYHVPNIIYAPDLLLKNKLCIDFDDSIENIEPLTTALKKQYLTTTQSLKEKLRLPNSQSLIFVRIVRPGAYPSYTRFVHGGSRFLIMNEAWLRNQNGLSRSVGAMFTHTLIHIFLTDITRQYSREPLPEWFEEMVAIAMAGNQLSDFQYQNPGRKDSDKLLQQYNAGIHLKRKEGSQAFYQLVRRAILEGHAETQLFKLYGYPSFEAVTAEALTLNARFGRWLEDIFAIESHVVRITGPPLILILLIVIAATSFLKPKNWTNRLLQKYVRHFKFQTGLKLQKKNQLEAALDIFNRIVRENERSGNSPGLHSKSATAQKHIAEIQYTLFERLKNDIDKACDGTAQNGFIEWAETLCYQLERLQTKFDNKFEKQTREYLRQHAPQVITMAWTDRSERFRNSKSREEIIAASQACLEYIQLRNESAYFPRSTVKRQLGKLLTKWRKLPEKPRNRAMACESYLAAQKMEMICKRDNLELPFEAGLQITCDNLQIYCQLEQVQAAFDSGAWFDALQMLSDLYLPLEAHYTEPPLRRQILECFDNNLVDPIKDHRAELKDSFFSLMILELQKKHLQRLIKIGTTFSDEQMTCVYREKLKIASNLEKSLRAEGVAR